MRRLDFILAILLVFDIADTLLAVAEIAGIPLFQAPTGSTPPSIPNQLLLTIERGSVFTVPIGWTGLLSLWIWRGFTKSRWERLGYDKDAFRLMTRMRGATTRLKLLEALDTPMDRLQLANRLGLDWKAIDRQTNVLCRYGLIREQQAYGKVKIYSLSESGKTMLRLVRELSVDDQPNRP